MKSVKRCYTIFDEKEGNIQTNLSALKIFSSYIIKSSLSDLL